MKRYFRLSVFVLVFLFSLFLPRLITGQELAFFDPGVTISMDLQDAHLRDILKILSIQSGLNFIASEAVRDRTITLYLDKVPVKEVMDKLFKANNLSYDLDRDSNIFIVKDWGKPEIETVTKIFRLKHATVSSSSLKEEMRNYLVGEEEGEEGITGGEGEGGKWAVEEDVGISMAVKKLLSEHGSLVEDFRTNSLVVTDIPSRMPVIARTIALLDVRIPQIMLEVEMLDVSKNVVDDLGFDFGSSPITLILPGGFARRGANFFMGSLADRKLDISSVSAPDSPVGKGIFGSTFAETLDFLRTQTDTKYLARPRILTLNNETAEIKITTQESVGVTTTAGLETGEVISTAPERTETGVSLRVTPQINLETGEITMFIYPKVAEATLGTAMTIGDVDYRYRDPEERSTKSVVRVKDGQTIIVGGLIRNEFSQVTKKIPILGDIPIIGFLFRHKEVAKDKERELLVFITPHIVKDAEVELAQAKKVVREQDLGRQSTISATLNNFERKRKK